MTDGDFLSVQREGGICGIVLLRSEIFPSVLIQMIDQEGGLFIPKITAEHLYQHVAFVTVQDGNAVWFGQSCLNKIDLLLQSSRIGIEEEKGKRAV